MLVTLKPWLYQGVFESLFAPPILFSVSRAKIETHDLGPIFTDIPIESGRDDTFRCGHGNFLSKWPGAKNFHF
jgi:hypothetical protein